MMGALSIAAGYLALIWACGWIGVAVVCAHVGLMLLVMGKDK